MEVAFCMTVTTRTVVDPCCILVYFWSPWVFKEGEPVSGCLSPVSPPVISFFREWCKESCVQT